MGSSSTCSTTLIAGLKFDWVQLLLACQSQGLSAVGMQQFHSNVAAAAAAHVRMDGGGCGEDVTLQAKGSGVAAAATTAEAAAAAQQVFSVAQGAGLTAGASTMHGAGSSRGGSIAARSGVGTLTAGWQCPALLAGHGPCLLAMGQHQQQQMDPPAVAFSQPAAWETPTAGGSEIAAALA